MKQIVAILWAVTMLGTVVVHLFRGDILLALRILVGSFAGLSAGLGMKGTFYVGSLGLGIVLASLIAFVAWLVLPAKLQLGPALFLPSIAWIAISVAAGFIFGDRQDVERGPLS